MPADVDTLNQWAGEGRIVADTVLIESGSNRQFFARDLQGLSHHFLTPQPQPTVQQPPQQPQGSQTYHQPYQPGGQQQQPGQGPYNQNQYQNPPAPYATSRKNKVAAAVLAFVLGCFGVHRFYLGYTQTAIIMLVIGILGYCLCGVGTIITAIWGIYDGIMILTDKMPDAQGQPLE